MIVAMSHHRGLPGSYRELDQRAVNGLTVTSHGTPGTAALRVVVVNRESAPDTFPVRAEDAADPFVHPFVRSRDKWRAFGSRSAGCLRSRRQSPEKARPTTCAGAHGRLSTDTRPRARQDVRVLEPASHRPGSEHVRLSHGVAARARADSHIRHSSYPSLGGAPVLRK